MLAGHREKWKGIKNGSQQSAIADADILLLEELKRILTAKSDLFVVGETGDKARKSLSEQKLVQMVVTHRPLLVRNQDSIAAIVIVDLSIRD